MSKYKEISFIVCATDTYANTEAHSIPVTAFKNLSTNEDGWLLSLGAGNQYLYIKYVDDTTIGVIHASTAYLRAIYGF